MKPEIAKHIKRTMDKVMRQAYDHEPEDRLPPQIIAWNNKSNIEAYHNVRSEMQHYGAAVEEMSCWLATNRFRSVYRFKKRTNPTSYCWNVHEDDECLENLFNIPQISQGHIDNIHRLIQSYRGDGPRLKDEEAILSKVEFDQHGKTFAECGTTMPDCFFMNEKEVVILQPKTPKPNSNQSESIKKEMLITKAFAQLAFPGRKISSYLAFHYNPSYDEYNHPYIFQYFDRKEMLIGEEWTNFIYGEPVWTDYLNLLKEVGVEKKKLEQSVILPIKRVV